MAGRLEDVRILIVDDDEDILEAMETALKSEGAQTQAVKDGNAAVAACADDPPDIVVLDMMLPRRSGFLVLEKIKGREDSPLVIMVTANEGKRHQAWAESLGADSYLLKPVPLERLIEVAVDLLDKDDAEFDDEDGDEGGDDEADDAPEAPPAADSGGGAGKGRGGKKKGS